MSIIRSPHVPVAALSLALWLPASQAQTCVQPGPLAQTYAVQASSHPPDDGFGINRRVHSYQFTVSQSAKLCSIGYEAPATPPVSYTFKLYNCNSGVPVPVPGAVNVTPGSFFGPGIQYTPISPAWPLLAGTCYELRRSVPAASSPVQRQGRRLDNETSYPINAVPAITILGTNFHNTSSGTQITNNALPYIDFGTR